MNLFWELHTGLPREGPGCDKSTVDALKLVVGLPTTPRILDIGCGPGRQTLVLARETQGEITAVDTHQPFLDDLSHRAAQTGFSNRIHPVNASMTALAFPDRAFDLIWSEGAIYIMGFAAGLRAWKRLVKPNGIIAVTEISWLSPNIPDEAKRFWSEGYPPMAHVEDNLKAIVSAGYTHVSHFVIPENAWWDEYYTPIEARIKELKSKYKGAPEAIEFLNDQQKEIDLYRKCSASYGYVFYIARNIEKPEISISPG